MYENVDDIFVVVAADFTREMIETLKGLGLDTNTHMDCIFDRRTLANGTPHAGAIPMIDFLLGFNRSNDLPGFKCLGPDQQCVKSNPNELRILILGGSTSDPEVMDPAEWNDPKKRDESAGSWPRFLHELLNEREIENIIYNGGLCGYTAAQEALKLMRDGLTLEPDMVIVLDGLNDACCGYWHEKKYPKVHSYFKVLEDKVKPLLSNSQEKMRSIVDTTIQDICYGIQSNVSASDEWYSNQRMMNALCREFGIEYMSFLQPFGLHLDEYIESCDVQYRTHHYLWRFFIDWGYELNGYGSTHNSGSSRRMDIRGLLTDYWNFVFSYEADARKSFKIKNKLFEDFHLNAKEATQKCDYIIDIVDTLNGHADVIYDNCHCTAKGNKLIAERIYRELVGSGALNRAIARVAERKNAG